MADSKTETFSPGAFLAKWPELPEKPEGWTKRMVTHVSMSDKKDGRYGIGNYTIHDPDGLRATFDYGYSTQKKGGYAGFAAGEDWPVMTWAELRAKWAEIRSVHLKAETPAPTGASK